MGVRVAGQAYAAYLIWCIAYANVEVLEMLHGQRLFSAVSRMGLMPRKLHKKSIRTERDSSQVDLS